MIKHSLLFILAFVALQGKLYGLSAQEKYVDSVVVCFTKSITSGGVDSALFAKGIKMMDNIPTDDSSIRHIENAAKLFQNVNDRYYLNQILAAISLRYIQTQEYYKAIEYGKNLIDHYEMSENENDRNLFLRVLAQQRIPYRLSDKLNKGFDYFTEKLRLYLQRNDSNAVAVSYFVLGGFYRTRGLYDLSIYNYKKASSYLDTLQVVENNELIGITGWANNMAVTGQMYNETGDYPEALYYSRKAQAEIKKHPIDSNNLAYTATNIAFSKLMLNQMDNVQDSLNYAITFAAKVNAVDMLTFAHQIMGIYFLKLNQLDSAEFYLQKCHEYMMTNNVPANSTSGNLMPRYYLSLVRIAQNRYREASELLQEEIPSLLNLRAEIIKEYDLLIQVYLKLGDVKNANETFARYNTLKEQLLVDERNNRKISFETEQKITEAENAIEVLTTEKKVADVRRNYLRGIAFILLLVAIVLYNRFRKIKIQKVIIEKEKKRSDALLLNILPSEVAEELKAKGSAEAKQFTDVTVMFTDFKNFTQISEKLTPRELVEEIHTCFKAFDEIIEKYNIEKIKTIGDSYMCAGGLPVANRTNATDVVNAALEIQQFMQNHIDQRKKDGKDLFEIRIGINTGPVVAGIVGVKKFAYDIWGDTVNIASRMESSGMPGKINISGSTYELVKNQFNCEHRGKIEAKNKGVIDMYFVNKSH